MENIQKWFTQMNSSEYLIIIGSIVSFIVLMIIIRALRLRKYRRNLVVLEDRMNVIKGLPILYRLGRVQGIVKNNPDVEIDYDELEKASLKLNDFQNNVLTIQIMEIEEKLYRSKLKNIAKKMHELDQNITNYDDESKQLLEHLEIITEIENEQRIALIKIKEKYRETVDMYTNVRYKIEEFVPAILDQFSHLDTLFIEVEKLMNDQDFVHAKEFSKKITQNIDNTQALIRDLPSYISIVRKFIPDRIVEINEKVDAMHKLGFALNPLGAITRLENIEKQLTQAIEFIKKLELAAVGQHLEILTGDVEQLLIDLDKEEIAFKSYDEQKENCFNIVNSIEQNLNKAIEDFVVLNQNYIVYNYSDDLMEHQEAFNEILKSVYDLNEIIESRNFSYDQMITRFNEITNQCQQYVEVIQAFNALQDSMRIQENRALDELDKISIVLLEIKSEIKNKHLPMINESYQDYIHDSYEKADEILKFTKVRPINLEELSRRVDTARDVIYKLYDNVHNLIVTAEMVEEAIVYGNRFRSEFLEVNTELTKAELYFKNGEYTDALSTAVDIIEKIKPGSYEMLIKKSQKV